MDFDYDSCSHVGHDCRDHHLHHPLILTWDIGISLFPVLGRLAPEHIRRNHGSNPLLLAVRCFEERVAFLLGVEVDFGRARPVVVDEFLRAKSLFGYGHEAHVLVLRRFRD